MEGAEGHGSRLLFLRCSQENQQIGRNRHNATPYLDPISSKKTDARVKAGLGGKEGDLSHLLLWQWQGFCCHLSWVAHTSDPWCLGSIPSGWGLGEESLRLGYRKGAGRGGSEGQKGRARLCYQSPTDGEQSANLHLSHISSCHQLLLLSISSHT
jgi:hypothetical protein